MGQAAGSGAADAAPDVAPCRRPGIRLVYDGTMALNLIADEARRLPPEPTSRWILATFAGAAVVWAAVFCWQVVVLPGTIAIRFDFSGEPTSRWDKWPAQILSAVLAVVMVAPALLIPRVVLRAPNLVSAPNSPWWTAAPGRLRRFERLIREDLYLLAAAALLLLALGEIGITIAATSESGGMPVVILVAMIVPMAGLIAVVVRMIGGGGRYDRQPDLDND